MKSFIKIFSILFSMMFFITSCQDDNHELGKLLTKEEVKYEVVQDLKADSGGNTVILKNNTPGTVSMWDYGTGRSNRPMDTVRFAFKGDYVIKFSALTAGGVIEMDPVTIKVTQDNLNYVNDPLWTLLTGGVGEEKTWVLDANAEGLTKYFTSPMYFAGESNVNSNFDGKSLVWTKVCSVPGGSDAICFAYEPNWKSDTWVGPVGDYGSMTFSLKGGPFVNTEHKMIAGKGKESGTYFLDTDKKTLTMTDATPLHINYVANDGVSLNNLVVVSLSENTMQLAVKNKAKSEYMVLNYISKEYSDNWVPEEPEGDPNFDHGDQSQILSVASSKTWKLDLEVPYNWFNLKGESLNPLWKTRADIIASGWAPYNDSDVANVDNASINFSADGKVLVKQDDGTSSSGTYTINESTNLITFKDVKPKLPIAGWVEATTTELNQWKIVKVEKAALNNEVIGIWFGKRDPIKDEYMVFHFVQR